jgi:hypothetical protein
LQFDLAVRAFAISLVVIGSTQAIRWLGPSIGGLIVGMPVVAAPAYFILMLQSSPEFVAESAAYSLLFLCAAQAFLVIFMHCVKRMPAVPCFCLAGTGWLVAILLLQQMPPIPWLGLLCFFTSIVVARYLTKSIVRGEIKMISADSPWLATLKGLCAGLLVTFTIAAAATLGPLWSGILLVFPIGYVAICATALSIYDADTLNAMLYSSMLGALSIACFCFVLAVTLPVLPPFAAFWTAVAAAACTTAILGRYSRRPAARS